jgi:hypothetical protein
LPQWGDDAWLLFGEEAGESGKSRSGKLALATSPRLSPTKGTLRLGLAKRSPRSSDVFINPRRRKPALFGISSSGTREHVVPDQKSINRTVSRLKVLRTRLRDQRLSRLDPVAIAEYRDTRLKLVGGNTVRKELVLLQTILDFPRKEWGVVLPWGNPVKGITKPKGSRPRDRRLEEGEESRLLAALDSMPTARMILPTNNGHAVKRPVEPQTLRD